LAPSSARNLDCRLRPGWKTSGSGRDHGSSAATRLAPGLRSLELADGAGLDTAFADIALIAAGCRFSDCAHDGEPGCAIQAALDDGRLDQARLENLRKIEREIDRNERLIDPRARAEQRAKWRRIDSAVNARMRARYRE
jgi:hypothetical protein